MEGIETYFMIEEQLYPDPPLEGGDGWREVPGTRYNSLKEVGPHYDKIKDVRPNRIVKVEKTVVTDS